MNIINKKVIKPTGGLSELDDLRHEVRDFISLRLEPMDVGRVLLALEEAYVNIIEHAKTDGSPLEVVLILEEMEDRFYFILEDNALKFDPMEYILPDLEEHGKAGKSGGLGVFLYRTLLETRYETTTEGGNRLILIKLVNEEDSPSDPEIK